MPQPRKNIISLADTSYFHCMSRCVRRAFLCGADPYSGKDYEHRREWLENKLHQVAKVFAVKLCAYAIMHNHYHVVFNVRSDLALLDWTGKLLRSDKRGSIQTSSAKARDAGEQ